METVKLNDSVFWPFWFKTGSRKLGTCLEKTSSASFRTLFT
jgi:hypothetical protein